MENESEAMLKPIAPRRILVLVSTLCVPLALSQSGNMHSILGPFACSKSILACSLIATDSMTGLNQVSERNAV